MDNAKDGVIYFSMGSNLKSKHMPATMKREFLEIFAQLKQTVIWKFEETLPEVPKNVHMLKWAPQQSILAHPNCVLFITHGGLLSSTETVHFGVPIFGIPVFGDQFVNVGRSVNKGIAVKVDLSYNTPKELKKGNPRSTQQSKLSGNSEVFLAGIPRPAGAPGRGAGALGGARDQDARRAAPALARAQHALVPEDVPRPSGTCLHCII
ncbi:Ecdysteroid UDP-glucosyltransferase [Eumeta japonica]|uniref:UDP-glucuronosyltransferase n=1 Tax=Eumeta variegata TaxID=151549 RepID=A0A4C1TL78_EUMVA|nr:Ecdysteroid UDP-glucosyltransferase [Eumeta japonica]